MKTYTPGQLRKLMETLEQQGVTSQHFQAVVGSGLVADIFHPDARIANRLAVRAALGLGALPSEPGSHTVDYGQSLEDMILAGNYDWKNDDITPERFPLEGEGRVEFENTLFHFGRNVSSREATKLIVAADPKNPWQPGKIENLLSFGAKNPEEQRKYPIVALSSSAKVNGSRSVAYLGGRGADRSLALSWWHGGWRGSGRFLAVRRVSRPSGS